MELEKYKECFDILKAGLKIAPKNKKMKKMLKLAVEKMRAKADKLAKKLEVRQKKNLRWLDEINKRQIALGKLCFEIPQHYNVKNFCLKKFLG